MAQLQKGRSVHEALAQADQRLAQIVEMRYFGGMTELEIAEALGLSNERCVVRGRRRG
ncbi:MAG: sigma factor-like helix-turn-helix DNA-binding protein [Caldimonas sp.]